MSAGLTHSDDSGSTVALGLTYIAFRDYSRGYRRCMRTGHPDRGWGLVE